jgi:hypothetical protein
LITIRDQFVGYVVPSKIHAYLLGKDSYSWAAPILRSTVWPAMRCRGQGIIDVGDDGLVDALLTFERALSDEGEIEL